MGNITYKPSIFTAVYESLKEKELKKLRLTRCMECRRFTSFRLQDAEFNTVQCKACGTAISLKIEEYLTNIISGTTTKKSLEPAPLKLSQTPLIDQCPHYLGYLRQSREVPEACLLCLQLLMCKT